MICEACNQEIGDKPCIMALAGDDLKEMKPHHEFMADCRDAMLETIAALRAANKELEREMKKGHLVIVRMADELDWGDEQLLAFLEKSGYDDSELDKPCIMALADDDLKEMKPHHEFMADCRDAMLTTIAALRAANAELEQRAGLLEGEVEKLKKQLRAAWCDHADSH